MEHTYTIRGADAQEYGPATLDQLTGWIREGRINNQSELKRSDMQHWSAASNFTELQPLFAPAPGSPPALSPTQPTAPGGDPSTIAQLKSGASWFYWIAALSMINSIAAAADVSWRFIFGLGVTQVLDAMGTEFGGAAKFVMLGLDIVIAGIFVFFGVFANKGHLWAFITGMALFAIDTLLMLLFGDWLGLAVHAFVLYCLFMGLKACRALKSN